MTYSVRYNPTYQIIEAQFQGDLTLQSTEDFAAAILKASKEYDCSLVLNDLREAQLKLSTFEIYDLPKMISKLAMEQGVEIYKLKRAFVGPKGAQNLNFFETVSVNRAQTTRYFLDIYEARNWLCGK